LRTRMQISSVTPMKRILLMALAGLALSVAGRAADASRDEVGKIAGVAIARDDGYIGLQITDDVFVLTFYNAKKKPVPAQASSAVLRWSVHYQPNVERTELLPSGDPAVLTSSYPVRAPHTFIVHILLLFDGKPDASESFIASFNE